MLVTPKKTIQKQCAPYSKVIWRKYQIANGTRLIQVIQEIKMHRN